MRSSHPLVSVVIPVKNGIEYLPETLSSVFSQDYDNLEIIVSDDGSTDGSFEYLIRETEKIGNLKVLQTSSSLRIDQHWTFVCEQSNGEYVKLLCSDDLITKNAISSQVSILESNQSVGLVATKRNVINPQGRIFLKDRGFWGFNGHYNGIEAIEKCIKSGTNMFGEPGAVLFRREALMQNLPWDASDPYMLDLEFYIRVLKNWDVYCSPITQSSFRIHSNSLTSKVHSHHTSQFMRLVNCLIQNETIYMSQPSIFFLRIKVQMITIVRSMLISIVMLLSRTRKKSRP